MASRHEDTKRLLERLLAARILVLDGAMGTMIQRLKFTEAIPQRGSPRIRKTCGNSMFWC
jgi:methionine synthase I (cobalamin-dependent)